MYSYIDDVPQSIQDFCDLFDMFVPANTQNPQDLNDLLLYQSAELSDEGVMEMMKQRDMDLEELPF